jgi:pyrimidine-nucleoside phosphorylase
LSSEEIAQIISGFTRGKIPDYQMSALALAIFFRGMSRKTNASGVSTRF